MLVLPRIVDSYGAGDAFVGGFLAAMARKHSIAACCQARVRPGISVAECRVFPHAAGQFGAFTCFPHAMQEIIFYFDRLFCFWGKCITLYIYTYACVLSFYLLLAQAGSYAAATVMQHWGCTFPAKPEYCL